MATITITYTKPVDASVVPAAQICAIFVPTNAAADNTSETGGIPGSYYDTNVPGYGAGMTPEEFFNSQVAHPGLIAALRAAMRATGSYDWEATDADVQYVGEIAPALKDQGFEFSTASSGSGT